MPKMMQEVEWNNDFNGDIFESILGKNDTDRVVLWVTWIMDMVAYREMKDEDIGNIVLHEARDEFEFEPRCKRKGNLI